MIRDVFHEMGGIGIYGVVSTLLFFAVFTGMLIRVFMMKRSEITRAKSIPLEPEDMMPDTGER